MYETLSTASTDQEEQAMADLGCNRRFHPKGDEHDPSAYWFFCRLPDGHDGDCDCPAAHQGPGDWED